MRTCMKALKLSHIQFNPSYLKLQKSTSTLLVSNYIGRACYVHKNVSTLTQNRVLEFVASLEESERQMLIDTLKKFETENVKFEVQGDERT